MSYFFTIVISKLFRFSMMDKVLQVLLLRTFFNLTPKSRNRYFVIVETTAVATESTIHANYYYYYLFELG